MATTPICGCICCRHRLVRPQVDKLDGVFGVLANGRGRSSGRARPRTWSYPGTSRAATPVAVFGVGKFPRMPDYVLPAGVRIAHADRVRLGASLAAGTTVMHEGFVNFNAGTIGTSMVEGRISAGVVVGYGTDVGGGASIMGTLSGGGKEVISVGALPARREFRLGHLARRRLRRRGRPVRHRRDEGATSDGQTVKARELSGGTTCCSVAIRSPGCRGGPRDGTGITPNEALHAN